MSQKRNRPGHWIRDIKCGESGTYGKDRINPHHPEHTGPGQSYKHGEKGTSHPSKTTHHHLHNAAQKIRTADNPKPVHAILNYQSVRRIDPQKPGA